MNNTVSNGLGISPEIETILEDAKRLYGMKDYKTAFEKFYEIAQLENPEAMLFLATMYRDGTGTDIDTDRFLFWSKRASDAGAVEAGYMYGMHMVKNMAPGSEEFKDGMKYIQKSADCGYRYAISSYVEIVLNGNVEAEYLENATKYCSYLESQTNEQEKAQYADKAKWLQEKQVYLEKYKKREKIFNVLRLVGPIFLIVGFLYWFGGLHPEEWHTNSLLKIVPKLSWLLVKPLEELFQKAGDVFSVGYDALLGVPMIALAYIMIFVSKPSRKERKVYPFKTVFSVSKFIIFFLIIWHLLMQVLEGKPFFGGMLTIIIAYVICYIIGRVAGVISKKIFK